MGALAVADTILLLSSAVFYAVSPRITYLREETIQVMCKVVVYSTFTSSQCGVFLILALLLERVIAVSKPMKAAILLSPKRALIISFCVLIFSAVFNVPFIFITSTNLQGETAVYMPCASETRGDLASVIHGMAGLVLNGVVPLVGILVMNLMILYVIKSSKYAFGKQKKAKKYFKNISSVSDSVDMTTGATVETSVDTKAIPQAVDYEDSMITTPDSSKTRESHVVSTDHTETSSVKSIKTEPSQSDMVNHSKMSKAATTSKMQHGQSQRERQLTMMTMVVTLAFLVCTLPKFVHILIFRNIEYQSSPMRKIVFAWSGFMSQNLNTLNSAINFYMYVLTGSKCRSDLKNLFTCRKGGLG